MKSHYLFYPMSFTSILYISISSSLKKKQCDWLLLQTQKCSIVKKNLMTKFKIIKKELRIICVQCKVYFEISTWPSFFFNVRTRTCQRLNFIRAVLSGSDWILPVKKIAAGPWFRTKNYRHHINAWWNIKIPFFFFLRCYNCKWKIFHGY